MAVRDGLERLGGARDIQIDLQSNLVTLRCGPSSAVDLAAVPRVIREAGFKTRDFRLRARGEFLGDGFRPTGWSQSIPYDGDASNGNVLEGDVLEARVVVDERGVRLGIDKPELSMGAE